MEKRRYTSQQVGLAVSDRRALAQLAAQSGKKNSEIARDAIRWYLENHENLVETDRDHRLTRVIYNCTDRVCGLIMKCTNRICSLQVRNLIDANMSFMLLYRLLPAKEADDIAKKMYRMAVTRVVRKISPQELNIENMIKEGLDIARLDKPAQGPMAPANSTPTNPPAATSSVATPATAPNPATTPTAQPSN
jgi:hypothetical protein